MKGAILGTGIVLKPVFGTFCYQFDRWVACFALLAFDNLPTYLVKF